MNPSVKTTLIPEKTSIKTMAIWMLLAFLGGQLSKLGADSTFAAAFALTPGTFLESPTKPNIGAGITWGLLAALLFFASFLALSLYPQPGRRQVVAGFLALVALPISFFSSVMLLNPAHIEDVSIFALKISFSTAILVCLLVSGRIRDWQDLLGMGLGLAIGIGLRSTSFYESNFLDFSPHWLSAVFFTSLFSRRRAAVLDRAERLINGYSSFSTLFLITKIKA